MNNKQLKKILDDPYNFSSNISIKELVEILKELSYKYYNKESPLVPDAIYDILYDNLKNRDPSNKFLKTVGSKHENDTKLPFPMPSLEKIKPDTDILCNWLNKYKGPYVLSDKLDGMSAMVYNNKGNIGFYTRGDGFFGKNISNLVKYIFKDINLPLNTAIRGELIIKKEDFKKLNSKYKNIRNTITTIRTRDIPDKNVLNISRFVAYSIVYPRMSHINQMKILKKTNLETVYYEIKNNIDAKYLSSLFEKRRKKSMYDIDGIVVVDSSKVYKFNNMIPKYAFAFKQILTDQIFESEVIDVIWTPSKHGYLKPVVKIKKVNINGVTISNATAYNAKFVNDNIIGIGTKLKLIRSGDVIPKIIEVIKPSFNKKPKMPSIPYVWNDTKVDIIIKKDYKNKNDIVLVKQLKHFFKTMKIKYLDEGVLTLLVMNGKKNIFDIVKTKKEDFSNISGLGEKLYIKIMKEIYNKISTSNLHTLMASTMYFGRGIGIKKLKKIVDNYPNILDNEYTNKIIIEKINKIKGFDDKTSKLIANGLPKFKNFYKKLSNIYDLSYLKKNNKKNNKYNFKDFKVVFTGLRDKDLENIIETNGGDVKTIVSKNTTHLIYKINSETSKFKKAKVLGIKIMTVEEFKKIYLKNN